MKKALIFLPILLFAAALLLRPELASNAVQDSLLLCLHAVIPSLFPFLVVISLLLQMGFARRLQHLFAPLMRPLFHLSGLCAAPLLAGAIGGYPTGAKAAADLYSAGTISRQEAERCLSFVNNCGPAFLLSYVGAGLFGSSLAGLYLFLIHVLSALLSGILLCRLGRSDSTPSAQPRRHTVQDAAFSTAFPAAVTGALTSTLNICGFVVLFRTAAALLPTRLPAWILGLFEMVTGISTLSPSPAAFAAAAGIVGWGGLSVHCQTMSVLAGSGLSLRWHWVGKTLQAGFSVVLATLAIHLL